MVTLNPRSAAALLLGGVGFFSSLSQPPRNQDTAQNPTPIIVRLDKTPRGVAYKVDSKPVSPTPTANLLYLLGQAYHEHGSNDSVVLLVDPRVPITDIWNVDGVAAKVPLTNIRCFVINRESGFMWELKWGPTMPISTNPN